MKIAALTMVYRDPWALSQWVRHYGRLVGPQNLFIVAHGPDPDIARLAPQASVITIPRDDLSGFDRKRAEMLNGFQSGLLRAYDWVIRTDADELICAETDLHDLLGNHADVPVLTALGFDLAEVSGDPDLADAPVFTRRRNAAFAGHYSKACIVNRPVDLMLHGTRVPPRKLETFPFRMPRGLYLAHIKYANNAEVRRTNAWRIDVASSPGRGLPGAGWKNADDDTDKFYDTFLAKNLLPWEDARDRAFDVLSVKPARLAERNLVKTRAMKFDTRTKLPDWFSDL